MNERHRLELALRKRKVRDPETNVETGPGAGRIKSGFVSIHAWRCPGKF